MKYLLFTVALFLCVNITAQELPKKSKIFVRVYNEFGKKIAKGKIMQITDSTLVLKKGSSSITIPSSDITYLKTKRGPGHNVAIGGALAVSAVLVGDIATPNAAGSSILAVIVFSPIIFGIGSAVGWVTTLFKNSTQYTFAGDQVKWKGFKEDMYSPQKY
jgi:RNase P/RNase MRP subunit p29